MNINLKKIVFPLSVGVASFGGLSLATNPKIDTQNRTEIQAEQKGAPLSRHAALALTAIGLGGIAVSAGGKRRKEIEDADMIPNSSPKEKAINKKIRKNLDLTITKNNTPGSYSCIKELTTLEKSILQKKNVPDNVAEKEAITIIEQLKQYAQSIENSETRQTMNNTEFPRLIYLVDKITSIPEEWENNRKKNYPHYEPEVAPTDYGIYRTLLKIYIDEAVVLQNEGQIKLFQKKIEKIKNMLLTHSISDTIVFADVIKNLYYLTTPDYIKDYNKHHLDYIPKENWFKKIGGCIQMPVYTNTANTFSAHKATVNCNKTNKTTQTPNQTKKSDETNNGDKKAEKDKSIGEKYLNKGINSDITFASVGGQEKAIQELKKKIMFPLRYPAAFKNRKLDKGLILYGPPGTGKTLLALALANESKANFIKINASDMTSKYHGESEKNWKSIFEEAKKSQPCIIFIDEFDTIAQARGHNASNNYDDTVLNQILAEMSDLEKNGDNVFIIGATNRMEEIDSAAKRAGRFGTHIEVTAPKTTEDVIKIFNIHTKNLVMEVNKDVAAQKLLDIGATGADIASIVDRAVENAYTRLGIYDKMENGTYNDKDLEEVVITEADVYSAIDDYKNKNA